MFSQVNGGAGFADDYQPDGPIQALLPILLPTDDLYTALLDMEMIDRGCSSAEKKFFLGDEIIENDGRAWSTKKIEEWSQEDTINWLISAASHMGQPYGSIQQTLAIPGQELINFTKQNFIHHDPDYGEKLYNLLHSQKGSKYSHNFSSIQKISNDRRKEESTTTSESEDSVEGSTKRSGAWRPRGLKQKKASNQRKLWEYIRDLLKNPETCPSLIRWEDYSQATFRFVKSAEVARRWGARNGNTKMTFDKLSRAMRYHYENKIFQSVKSPLVYQFGPNAKGWQTDNPNFHR